ncbi:Hpt domain-containing protein [Halopseudomonas pelagia]|uniref:Hpt domain-containing protein n=1 Tax=Halopseudomonas pelagia TaxID=553151 RepID=UPI00039DCFE8|nr:Hpt domain-containing protein [Halopseudomonas pelagia]|tara:strand:- start:73169 stop:73507 length:339 start_codon:yes stop_codon:yes gene_type:complete
MSDLPKDLDPAVQSNLRELMQEDYPLLIDTFIQDAQKRLAALADALEHQQWNAFRQAAHSFKGSCGNMGAQTLEQACERAEQAGLLADAEAAGQCYLEIRRLYQRVQLHLQH